MSSAVTTQGGMSSNFDTSSRIAPSDRHSAMAASAHGGARRSDDWRIEDSLEANRHNRTLSFARREDDSKGCDERSQVSAWG